MIPPLLFRPELSRQSCEIRYLLKCKSILALDKVNNLTRYKKILWVCSLGSKNLLNFTCFTTELSRQSCEIRDLLKCKSRLALDKVNDFKGLKSCKILMLWCLFKGYTLSMLISFIKEIEFSLILMAFLLYLMQVRTCIVIGEVSYFATLSR